MTFIKYNYQDGDIAKRQVAGQLVDVTLWRKNREIEIYPEGARAKEKITCPEVPPYPFLIASHDYLFKQSNPRYPAQFWVEIIAYRLGRLMGVPVPPAFIGIDKPRQVAGAVIEWFYNYPGESVELYTRGGDYMEKLNPAYDRKKGEQNNFIDLTEVIRQIKMTQNWQEHWAKVFCFDALTGNTDRHQDNWGIVHWQDQKHFSPAFDNGTALGHEIIEKNLKAIAQNLEKYTMGKRATHHSKWQRNDMHKIGHFDLLKKLKSIYPSMASFMNECIGFSTDSFAQEVAGLVELSNTLEAPYAKLTAVRADFIINLVEFRKKKMLEFLT